MYHIDSQDSWPFDMLFNIPIMEDGPIMFTGKIKVHGLRVLQRRILKELTVLAR